MPRNWSAPVAATGAYRRAGGRRRYNAGRRTKQELRRERVAELMRSAPCPLMLGDGWRAQTARELGISPSTLSRDVAAVRATIDLPVWGACCLLHSSLEAQEAAREEANQASLVRSLSRLLSPAAIARVLRDEP